MDRQMGRGLKLEKPLECCRNGEKDHGSLGMEWQERKRPRYNRATKLSDTR